MRNIIRPHDDADRPAPPPHPRPLYYTEFARIIRQSESHSAHISNSCLSVRASKKRKWWLFCIRPHPSMHTARSKTNKPHFTLPTNNRAASLSRHPSPTRLDASRGAMSDVENTFAIRLRPASRVGYIFHIMVVLNSCVHETPERIFKMGRKRGNANANTTLGTPRDTNSNCARSSHCRRVPGNSAKFCNYNFNLIYFPRRSDLLYRISTYSRIVLSL